MDAAPRLTLLVHTDPRRNTSALGRAISVTEGKNALRQPTTQAATPPQLVVRIKLGGDGVFGPGKADLLESIDRLGSISAAARAMRMSYRQAWMLLDTMNQAFRGPLVETSQGGPRGGGAALTHMGKRILVCYRALQRKAAKSTRDDLEAILSLTAAGLRHEGSDPRAHHGGDDASGARVGP